MKTRGVLLSIVVAGALFLVDAPQAFAGEQPRQVRSQEEGSSTDSDVKPYKLNYRQGKARSKFPSSKSGEKAAGWCDIDCGGYGTVTWAEDVGDCACQCASYCSSDCFAWEVGGPNTAYCFLMQ